MMSTRNARRDMGEEATQVLLDLTLTDRQAVDRAARMTRRMTPPNQSFVVAFGVALRIAKGHRRFDEDQLSRWADDGGAVLDIGRRQ